MKKLLLLFSMVFVLGGVLVLPAAAQDEDFTTLAQYFPADAPLYASARTDDDFLTMIDSLVERINAAAPNGASTESLMDSLDQLAATAQPGSTFEEAIRPWLGDQAAVGMFSLEEVDMPQVTIALSITDQDEAEAFFAGLPNADEFTKSTGDGYVVYTPTDEDSTDNPYVIFRDDVMLLTADESLVASGGVVDGSLAQSDALSTALGLLPADQYNGVIYIDTPAVLQRSMSENQMSSMDQSAMDIFESFIAAMQPQAFGFTVLNEHALTIDVASPLDAAAASSLLGVETRMQPVDLSFAQHIPAGTPLVIHSTNLYGGYQQGIDSLRAFAATLPKDANMSEKDVDSAMFAVNFVIRGLTGLQTEDALGWMTGDYALYLKFSPEFSDSPNLNDAPTSLPIDFGFAFSATDPEAVQKLYDGMSESLASFAGESATITEETLGSGDKALVITLSGTDMPFPIELLIAQNDEVFIFGTRRMVTAALTPDNGLDNDATFVDAGTTLLENPNAVFYLSGNGLLPFARAMINSSSSSDQRDGEQMKAVLSLVRSATISTSVLPNDSGTLARFVWTLPE